jgi:hypothetical protein
LATGLYCSLKISVAEPEPQEAETFGWSRSHNEVLAPSQAQEIYTFLIYYLKIYYIVPVVHKNVQDQASNLRWYFFQIS